MLRPLVTLLPPLPVQVFRWCRAGTHCENSRRFERATLRFRRIPLTVTDRSERRRIWEHQDPQEMVSITFQCRSTGIRPGIGLVQHRSQSTSAVHPTHSDHVASDTCLLDHATAIEWSTNRTQLETLHQSTDLRTLLKCLTLAAMTVAIARTNVSDTVALRRVRRSSRQSPRRRTKTRTWYARPAAGYILQFYKQAGSATQRPVGYIPRHSCTIILDLSEQS